MTAYGTDQRKGGANDDPPASVSATIILKSRQAHRMLRDLLVQTVVETWPAIWWWAATKRSGHLGRHYLLLNGSCRVGKFIKFLTVIKHDGFVNKKTLMYLRLSRFLRYQFLLLGIIYLGIICLGIICLGIIRCLRKILIFIK